MNTVMLGLVFIAFSSTTLPPHPPSGGALTFLAMKLRQMLSSRNPNLTLT